MLFSDVILRVADGSGDERDKTVIQEGGAADRASWVGEGRSPWWAQQDCAALIADQRV